MELSIRDFAKIKQADIVIDGITVIAGENNTGKSTVGKILFSLFNSLSDIEEKIFNERMREPISYLFPAIIITMAGVLVFKIYKKGKGRIRFSCILFIIYIEILMQTAFFSREPGSRQQIDLNLFGTWGQTAIAHAYFIENIIMFIPFGLLAPMVFERMRKVRFCVFIGFLCSCGIELSQLITQRGYCQLDDVVTNTVGMLVGWGIWKMLSSVGIAGNPLF